MVSPEEPQYAEDAPIPKLGDREPNPPLESEIAFRPGEDMVSRGHYWEALRVLTIAELRVITTANDNYLANLDLNLITKLRKAMEAKKKELLAPHKQSVKDITDTFAFLMTPIMQADAHIRQQMLAWNAELKRLEREQEAINQLRIEAARKEAAINQGAISEPLELIDVKPVAPNTKTDLGTTTTVDCWKFEIVDLALLPREYMVPDTSMLNTTAKSHHDKKVVAGVRFYNEPIIQVRPR